MNVVIYCRYSSHNQQETSIEGQLKVCHEYCERKGYTVINEYIDRAISGTTDNRPEFLRMIEDSAKKHFQYVVVYQLDRFSRNRYDSATYKAKLKKNGIRVLSARENISEDASGILMEAVLEGMAEYYSAELGQKVTRGMDLNAQKCLSTGGNIPLGFKVGADKRFEIDVDTAPIVQYIFETYASGKTIVEITEHLNANGHRTSSGALFNKNSLRTMLKNKKYIGIYTYKGNETPDGMPRIITDELFFRVAEIMDKNKKAPARTKAKVEYLLTTKLFCGYCKEMMTGFSGTGKSGTTYRYYVCNGTHKKICKKKAVGKDYIENLVISECRGLLTNENIQKIANEVVALCNAEKDTANLKRLNKLLSENNRKHKNLMNAIMECDIESVRKSLYAEMPALEKEHAEIEKEIELEQKSNPSLTIPQIKFFLNALKKGNADDIKYRKTLISVLINSIYLYDDKITLIFNSGDTPVTIDDKLLSDIETNNQSQKCLFLNNVGPP
ncbi:MAG: recombinase family protein [Bacillota bacterium]|nr:recombinase family protein [Bacillota bacterium]